jgi:hypothetical protein
MNVLLEGSIHRVLWVDAATGATSVTWGLAEGFPSFAALDPVIALLYGPVDRRVPRVGHGKKTPPSDSSDGDAADRFVRGTRALPAHSTRRQSIMGAMMRAKLFRARFSRLFTVPRLVSVISAISS